MHAAALVLLLAVLLITELVQVLKLWPVRPHWEHFLSLTIVLSSKEQPNPLITTATLFQLLSYYNVSIT